MTDDDALTHLEESLARKGLLTPDEFTILGLVQRLRAVTSQAPAEAALPDAAVTLAMRTLHYVGWLDGTFSDRMDSDVALKDAALAVFGAVRQQAPARVRLKRRAHD